MSTPFQPGTWVQLPSNCTQSFTLVFKRCASWGRESVYRCVEWVTETVTECVEWGWSETKKCSWWSWLFCLAWAVIVSVVCLALGIVAIVVCAAFAVVVIAVCLLWTVITFIFCLSNANGGSAFLLTDGTVMMQESAATNLYFLGIPLISYGTNRWWKLTPDKDGSYANGSWSRLADSKLQRLFCASAVLADGRLVLCGGEYSDASGNVENDYTNTCEIYDPVKNTWTSFDGPSDSSGNKWPTIGDAPSAVLADGSFLIGWLDGPDIAKLDPATLAWTPLKPRPLVGTSDEDSWVLMPDGTVVGPSCQLASPNATTWVYDPASNTWTQGNDLPVGVVDTDDDEIGPGLLRYDGTAFFIGANGHTAIYDPSQPKPQRWSNGPDLPTQGVSGTSMAIGIHDGPGCVMVNGNVLFGAGVKVDEAGTWSSPSWFFEFDGTAFQRTADPPNNAGFTYLTRLLMLPNGDVLFCREDDDSFYAYHSEAAVPDDSYRPVIQDCPAEIAADSTIQVSGLQFNGLSQCSGYGDDFMNATNYPLVRIVNDATGHVRYCRTHDHTTPDDNGVPRTSMGVATGSAVITTNVDIPYDIETGASQLYVVANGIPSEPFPVDVYVMTY